MPEMPKTLSLPDLAELDLDWPDLAALIVEYRKLADAHRTASSALSGLLDSRPAAIEADRTAYAAAIRAGKDDPGEAALAKLNTKISSASRKSEALAVAVGAAAQDLAGAVERRRIELVRDVGRAIAQDHEALADAVARWEAARAGMQAHKALLSWVREFPARSKYVPGVTPPIAGLIGRIGDAVSYSEILDALRRDAEPQAVVTADPAAA